MDSFQVDTVCPEISEAIQKVAFENGWKWTHYGSETKVLDLPGTGKYLVFGGHDQGKLGHNPQPFNPHIIPVVTIEQCIARLKQPRTRRVKVRDIKTHCPSPVEWQAIVKTYPDLEIELPA